MIPTGEDRSTGTKKTVEIQQPLL